MKRHKWLKPLSDDHHRALVLARRLRQLSPNADSAEIETLAREVQIEFGRDLEPHFRREEEGLLSEDELDSVRLTRRGRRAE
jgi:hypothetical protein